MAQKYTLDLNEVVQYLEDSSSLRFKTKVPAFRSFDISRDVDLIEEVLRIYGYTNIEPLRPEFPAGLGEPKNIFKKIRNFLTDRGFNEVITFPWLEERLRKLFNLNSYWEIVNPLNSEQRHMRTSLIPSLLKVAKFNQSNFNRDIAVFELGKVYFEESEENRLGLLAAGKFRRHFSREEEWSFLTFKGILEALLTRFGLNVKVKPKKVEYMHPYLCGSLIVGDTEIGYFGKLHPQIAEELELKLVPFVGELNVDLLKEFWKKPTFKGISKFPPVKRDFAFVFKKDQLKAEGILETAKEIFGNLLEEAYIFDVYEGDKISPDEVSVAVRITLRNLERSLADEEVNNLAEKYIKTLEKKGYRLRS